MKLFKTAALAVAVSMIGLSVVSDVAALPPNGYIYFYYSDAAKTDEVGQKWLSCSGGHGTIGTVTTNVEKMTWDCNVGDPPGFPF